jgi:type II secretory pathway component PulF
MAFIITPRQLAVRSELYHQIGSMLSAGLPLPKVLETLKASPPSYSLRPHLARILRGIEEGNTFTESVRGSGNWLPSFDIALLEAGETSGRLDAVFKLLAVYYNGRAQLARTMISDLAYPLFVLHFGILIIPLPQLILKGDVVGYATQTLGVLGPIYAVVFLILLACQGRHGEVWRSLMENITGLIPILGTARRHLALARLSAALEALINAGVSTINAWELAGAASGSPAIRREVMSWRPRLESGQNTPAELISQSGEFPEMYANLYHSGEISGQTDDTLRRLFEYYQDDGTRKMRALAQWLPRLVYLVIALRIAFQVVSFWQGYYKGLGEALDF